MTTHACPPPPLFGATLASDDGVVRRWDGVDGTGAPVTVLTLHPAATADPRIAQAVLGFLHDTQLPGAGVLVGSGPQGVWAAARRPVGGPGLEVVIPALYGIVRDPTPGRSHRGWVIGTVAAALVVAAIGAVGVSVAASTDDGRAAVIPAGRDEDVPGLEGPEPVLDPTLPPVHVVGPTFEADDPTRTFAFDGYPFAFRGTDVWLCSDGLSTLPDSYGLVCADESWEDRQTAEVMVRPCPRDCSAQQRSEANEAWFGDLDDVSRSDDTTWYREGTHDGLDTVAMSHFFVRDGLTWQVGVHVETPPDERAEVLKLLNDIRTQTP